MDLLVFVSVFRTANPYDGGYIQVLRINLADDDPEFSLAAELGTNKFCTGMCLQHGNVVAGFYAPGVHRAEAFAWNWKNRAKVEVSSPEGKHWFLVVSETLSVLWDANNRSIDLRRSTKSDHPNEAHHHLPRHSDTLPDPPQDLQAIIPVITECKKLSGDTSQVALAHLEDESLRIDIEDGGAGRVSFTRYPKDNTYMQNPEDPEDRFGNGNEAPKSFIQTVSGHLVEMASSGRLTTYFASDQVGETNTEKSVPYFAFTELGDREPEPQFPFLCPFQWSCRQRY